MNPNDEQKQQLIFVPSLEEGPTYRVLSDLMSFPLGSTQTEGTFLLCFNQVPPQGEVAMHRQTAKETFIVWEGEIEFSTLSNGAITRFRAPRGAIVHVPEGVAHAYRNVSEIPASMLVLFMPAGQTEHFFARLGVPVTDRTQPPPPAMPDPVLLQKLLKNSQVQIVPLPEEG
ncbi:MAG: cupin domain-containing protein [Ktedonobacteraceae bacterium]